MNRASLPLTRRVKFVILSLIFGVGIVFFFSNPNPQSHFDYTFRIAGAMLHGRIGLPDNVQSCLNEMVPFEGAYYSVFPLGSVLTMLPAALLKEIGIIEAFPASGLVALTGGVMSVFLYLLTLHYDISHQRRWNLVIFIMFGTWMWCNLVFGSAWQIALGFSVLGQLGALYFILANPRPLIAGLFFSLAFGNRTEIILLTPIFLYLLCRDGADSARMIIRIYRSRIVKFFTFPFLLGTATLIYNYARFHSPFDFGYARIPHVLEEQCYRHGIFSIHSIPLNMKAMLFEPWRVLDHYPYLIPSGFGGSIILSSPALVLVFRNGAKNLDVKISAWIAIAILTLLLWVHGNPGGWQFAYRYAMILLPWVFLILLENSQNTTTSMESVLFNVSVGINAYATYLFLWTNYVQP